jgi:SAM-dependent methyltransferase
MSGFDTPWLDLRDPADTAARDAGLLAAAAAHLESAGGDVLDLGCGTGATFRALAPRLRRKARWRLLDNDPVLLDEARRRLGEGEDVITHLADLADVEALPIEGVGLVTASALLDLVSEPWLESLAGRLIGARTGLYAALNYDGSTVWDEAHALDAPMLDAFNAHQVTDKGLGAALGPGATAAVLRHFSGRGYEVAVASSPWRLKARMQPLQHRLIAGIADAAAEMDMAADAVSTWRAFRQAAAGRSGCIVGHADLLVLPA